MEKERFTDYDVAFEIYGNIRGAWVTKSYRASIRFDHDTTPRQIADFSKAYREGFRAACKAAKNGCRYVVQVSKMTGYYKNMAFYSEKFDYWNGNADGYIEKESGAPEGLYLNPDTRYTDETHDAVITSDFFESFPY